MNPCASSIRAASSNSMNVSGRPTPSTHSSESQKGWVCPFSYPFPAQKSANSLAAAVCSAGESGVVMAGSVAELPSPGKAFSGPGEDAPQRGVSEGCGFQPRFFLFLHAARCRIPQRGAHYLREIMENIGISACFPIYSRLAGGPPAPRHPIRFPPAFQCPRSGFHCFQCRHPLRFPSARARQDAAPPRTGPTGHRGLWGQWGPGGRGGAWEGMGQARNQRRRGRVFSWFVSGWAGGAAAGQQGTCAFHPRRTDGGGRLSCHPHSFRFPHVRPLWAWRTLRETYPPSIPGVSERPGWSFYHGATESRTSKDVVRLWKMLGFSPVFSFPGASRAGRLREVGHGRGGS